MKVALAMVGFCIGILLMPFLPFALAAFAWNEFDKGDYIMAMRNNSTCRDCPLPCNGMRRCSHCGKTTCEVSGITSLCPECEAEILNNED